MFMVSLRHSLEDSGGPLKILTKDDWKLLRYGLLTALLMGLVLVPILAHDGHFPKVAAEAILAVIAGLVFLIYRYIERRKINNLSTRSNRRKGRIRA
jgi:hypothetical protein